MDLGLISWNGGLRSQSTDCKIGFDLLNRPAAAPEQTPSARRNRMERISLNAF
jgi:hypothetical protein